MHSDKLVIATPIRASLSGLRNEESQKINAKMIEFQEGYHTYYTYIITNKAKTVFVYWSDK